MSDQWLLRIEILRVTFARTEQEAAGVEDLSFDVAGGGTVCVVEDSGSGKSAKALA
ncbi:MAG: hypothetical protein AAF066_11905 [Pseudomonadota bacterium]